MPEIVFIDPQSYNNLCLYDKGVLSEFKKGEVTFFGSNLWNCEPMQNVETRLWFNYNSFKNPIRKAISYAVTLFNIARYIKQHDVKVVHIQWIRLMQVDMMFISFLKRRNIKIVYTAHNILPHDSGNRFAKQFNKYYNAVDRIIVHSLRTKTELSNQLAVNEVKIDVIPHGIIDIQEPTSDVAARIEQLSSKYNLSGKIIFSSLGAQTNYKGVDNIVKAWSEHYELTKNSDCHLLIVGKNSDIDFSTLEGLDNVTIIDERLSNLDFLCFIKLSDVILLPYRKISQSGVLFSAINNNVPVLVSDVGGLTEPLVHGQIGWNMKESTLDNLSYWLEFLSKNPNEILRVKKNSDAFKVVKEFYSWKRISNMTKELYYSLF